MKLFETLDEDKFMIYAAKHYHNPTCIDAEEFYKDVKRFKYVKRLVNKHLNNNTLSIHLLLNHLIIIFNVFGVKGGLKMLEYKLDEDHWPVIKPFLIYLRIIKNEEYIGIMMDKNVIEELRKI